MAFFISNPISSFSGDVTQLSLGTSSKTTTTLVANTAANIIPDDETATLGRKILSLNNTSSTDAIKVAMGRVATASDYDFILPAQSQILDWEWNDELVSAISTGTPTVITNTAKRVEI